MGVPNNNFIIRFDIKLRAEVVNNIGGNFSERIGTIPSVGVRVRQLEHGMCSEPMRTGFHCDRAFAAYGSMKCFFVHA